MAAFAKFDPSVFLEREQEPAPNASLASTEEVTKRPPKTLASLAALAAQPSRMQNHGVDHKHHEDHRAFQSSPAKVAKVAKVEPSITLVDEAPWGETEEERAAIAEYDGGAPRVWAEALARLDLSRPPCDIPPRQWLQFIDDCGRFIDDGWPPCAEALGWTPLDLFGCDRVKPFARIDRAGLLWLLDGKKLLALAHDSAAIATPSGGTLKYRRYPNEPGRVLAWELALNAA